MLRMWWCRMVYSWSMGRITGGRQCGSRSRTGPPGSRRYSDRSYQVRKDGVLDDIPTFTLEELRAIVDEAHRERCKVASHAMALNGVHNSVEAGVDTIEHGNYIAEEDLKTMAARGI